MNKTGTRPKECVRCLPLQEVLEFLTAAGAAEFAQGLGLNLLDTLPRHVELFVDLLQGARLPVLNAERSFSAFSSRGVSLFRPAFCATVGMSATKSFPLSQTKGFRTIGAIRTNRLVRCEGGKAQTGQPAPSFHLAGVTPDLVTVGQRQFFVYRLEAGLKGVPNAVVLISYPRNAFGVASALRAFVCTNPSMSTTTILNF